MIAFVIKCKELLDCDNFYILDTGGSKFKNFVDLIDSNVSFFFLLSCIVYSIFKFTRKINFLCQIRANGIF